MERYSESDGLIVVQCQVSNISATVNGHKYSSP